MKIPDDLRRIVEITNQLDNFVPLGVIYVTGWPDLPAAGLSSSLNEENWKWVDFPFIQIPGVSPLLDALILLVRKAYCRLTYRIFDQLRGIAVVRVFLFPGDSLENENIKAYREKYFRFKRPLQWLEKQSFMALQNLLSITDFNPLAFNLNSTSNFITYMKYHVIPVVNFMADGPQLTSLDQGEFNHHLNRMKCGESFSSVEHNIIEKDSMQTRLTDVYSNIESPSLQKVNIRDEEMLQMYDAIQSDEIPGFKSLLYSFQKRSVLKMVEKETNVEPKLMPHIIKLYNNTYYDIRSLLPVVYPKTYIPPRGGILAENMGLGKTCISLAVICFLKFKISEIPDDANVKQKSKREISTLIDYCADSIVQRSIPWKEYYDDFPSSIVSKLEKKVGYFEKRDPIRNTRKTRNTVSSKLNEASQYKKYYLSSTTLVVLPDNLFHQWRVEIFKHVKEDFLKVLEIQTNENMSKVQTMSLNDIIKHDVIMISNSVFSKQFENPRSVLKSVYWKRLIIDEGHSMNSKSSKAVLLTKKLHYERMWVISGTPTSGLTNLHMESDLQEYNVQKAFHPRQDLEKLGVLVTNFFKIEPWTSNKKLWTENIIKPFEHNDFNIIMQLKSFLSALIVRHNVKDVEDDILLPKLHHKPVFLKPSFFDRLTINLFISVLATNAITSNREGTDYMFDPSNKADLRRLVTNLQKGTFYWTSFSIKDVENLLNFCVFSLREKDYTDEDKKTLTKAIYYSKVALSNMRWRAVTTIHEMGYFVKNLPKAFVENYSLVKYNKDVSIFGYPHLISIQKFFYTNRIIKSEDELRIKIAKESGKFWGGYWKSMKSSNRPLSNKDDIKGFKMSNVQQISKLPEWVNTFDLKYEEEMAYGEASKKSTAKRKIETINKFDNIGKLMRKAETIGTLSMKLNYLTMRLLENQNKGIKSIVFYEFENSAYYLTELLDILGMNYIMYAPYIKPAERSNNITKFDRWDQAKNEGEGVALIMDLKLASHGLTIIAATHVFFINPVWNQTIEAQAIKRAHRIGQMNEVFVETLILENTLEQEMYNMRNETKNANSAELIDHTKIRDYILKFPFLKIFIDGSFDEEYCTFETPLTEMSEPERPLDDGMALDVIHSEVLTESTKRLWKLPLFTKKNLDKLTSNHNKALKRGYDDIEQLKYDELHKESDELKRSKIMEKLRMKRFNKVRFNV